MNKTPASKLHKTEDWILMWRGVIKKECKNVVKKKIKSKEERIKEEKERLICIYKEIPDKEFKTAEKLIYLLCQ